MASIRVAEFYSGIGGLRLSMDAAIAALDVDRDVEYVVAYDVNTTANQVYRHNFGEEPRPKTLNAVTLEELEALRANVWLLSPPCQPFTRNGNRMGTEDVRSSSLMYILGLIVKMQQPPQYVFLENVVGFERSAVREMLIESLHKSGLNDIVEFHLSPLELGMPYSRPRYYCIARVSQQKEEQMQVQTGAHRLRRCLPGDCARLPSKLQDFLEGDMDVEALKSYALPLDESLVKNAAVLDVVSCNDVRCNCFTKSYGTFWKGTGSVISQSGHSFHQPDVESYIYRRQLRRYQRSEEHSEERNADSTNDQAVESLAAEQTAAASLDCSEVDPADRLKELKLRYFTEREICNLHGFPQDFSFPESTSRRQRFKMLGNSISVTVASKILQLLFSANTETSIIDHLNSKVECKD